MRRHLPLVTVATAVLLVVSGCTSSVVTDYGADAKKNFTEACRTDTRTDKGKLVETATLATKTFCECVYNAIDQNTDKHYLKWDDLSAYEEKVADAKAGEVPDPPKQLVAAAKGCQSTVSK